MKNNVYKSNYQTIWCYTFETQDDQMYNNDIKSKKIGYVGTKDEFNNYKEIQQIFWGTVFLNVKKRHANARQARDHKMENGGLIVFL